MVQESKKKAAALKLSIPEGYHFSLRTTEGKVGMMYPHLPCAYPGAQVAPPPRPARCAQTRSCSTQR